MLRIRTVDITEALVFSILLIKIIQYVISNGLVENNLIYKKKFVDAKATQRNLNNINNVSTGVCTEYFRFIVGNKIPF